jgi:class 3 adenylate cyclase
MEAAQDTAIDEDGEDPDANVQISIGLHCGPVHARCY